MIASVELTPKDARALYDYNQKVFDRFLRRVERLPKKEAHREREIGHQSFFNTLVHILNVHEAWVVYILDGRARELRKLFEDPTRHPSDWAGLHAYAKKVWAGVDDYLDRATPARLGRRVRAPWMPGSYAARDGLLQASFEQAHHLGEIIGGLWQDDLPSPAMTWIEVGRSKPAHRGPRR